MVVTCLIKLCENHSSNKKGNSENLSFVRVPRDETSKEDWAVALNVPSTELQDWRRVCNRHFEPKDFDKHGKLQKWAIPNKNIPPIPTHTSTLTISNRRTGTDSVFLVMLDTYALEIIVRHETGQASPNCVVTATKVLSNPLHSVLTQKKKVTKKTSLNRKKNFLGTTSDKSKITRLKNQKKSSLTKRVSWHTKCKNAKALKANLAAELKKNLTQFNKSIKLAKLDTKKEITKKLGKLFTDRQISMILEDKSKTKWSDEEISKCIALRCQSTKAYNYIRDVMKMPLPSIDTLQRWTAGIDFSPGILTSVINLLKEEFKMDPSLNGLCCISFDEMMIDSRVCYDPKEDRILGPKSKLMLCVVKGLCGTWKQPIFYDFDTDITPEIFKNIVVALHAAGLDVRTVVNDLDGKNRRFWNQMGVSHEHSFAVNPVTGNKIWFFADILHMYKLMRNNNFDYGFRFEDGKVLLKDDFVKLIELDKNELKINFKLTPTHLDVEGRERQRVRPALQVYSNTTGEAMKYLSGMKPSTYDKSFQGEFIKIANDALDIFNTRARIGPTAAKCAYGLNPTTHEIQNETLTKMENFVSSMRIIKKTKTGKDWKGLFPFQKGIITSISSLKGLYDDLNLAPYNLEYILTHNLNQDVVENAFSIIRSIGAYHDHPTILDAKNRLKIMLLSWNCTRIRRTAVQMEDESASYVSLKLLRPISGVESKEVNILDEEDVEDKFTEPIVLEPAKKFNGLNPLTWEKELKKMSINELCELGGQEYISGYIASKLQKKFPKLVMGFEDGCSPEDRETPSWTQTLSQGGLTIPSWSFLNICRIMDSYFEEFHNQSGDRFKLNRQPGVMSSLVKIINEKFPNLEIEAIKLFVKTRTFIRIKAVNHSIADKKRSIQRKNRQYTKSSVPSESTNLESESMNLESESTNLESESSMDVESNENPEEQEIEDEEDLMDI